MSVIHEQSKPDALFHIISEKIRTIIDYSAYKKVIVVPFDMIFYCNILHVFETDTPNVIEQDKWITLTNCSKESYCRVKSSLRVSFKLDVITNLTELSDEIYTKLVRAIVGGKQILFD